MREVKINRFSANTSLLSEAVCSERAPSVPIWNQPHGLVVEIVGRAHHSWGTLEREVGHAASESNERRTDRTHWQVSRAWSGCPSTLGGCLSHRGFRLTH